MHSQDLVNDLGSTIFNFVCPLHISTRVFIFTAFPKQFFNLFYLQINPYLVTEGSLLKNSPVWPHYDKRLKKLEYFKTSKLKLIRTRPNLNTLFSSHHESHIGTVVRYS